MSETGPQSQPDEALVDLLVKQLTDGLSPAEQRELDVLDGPLLTATSRDLERAVAAVSLAASGKLAPLPELLKARLQRQAQDFFEAAPGRPPQAAGPAPAPASTAPAAVSLRSGGAAGWWAAAACLLIAMYAWFRPPAAPIVPPAAPMAQVAVPPPRAPVPPTPAEARAELLRQADAVKAAFGATHDPAAAGVTGDVVWDPATQRGFVRFAGLHPIDPNQHVYQIWIFDAARDPRYPVDAGMFDVAAGQTEVVVAFHGAIPVHLAKAFAVTLEKSGGVVVSARDHVVALAQAT